MEPLITPIRLLFLFKFSAPIALASFLYSMIIMGTHGAIWHHRYCMHGAYKFGNKFWRLFTDVENNLTDHPNIGDIAQALAVSQKIFAFRIAGRRLDAHKMPRRSTPIQPLF
ncbi:hypothetical protein [Dyadobacter endophyticus]|uniref:hypothetical protein n=1 Tax=Dyadobacter endophyticus TaxID=1749036 RepID=UPI001E4C07CE|nr:hypothetical protein [Dyadobacter endophyticus]